MVLGPGQEEIRKYFVVPENIHNSPVEGTFSVKSPTPLEIPMKLHTFCIN